MGMSCVVNWGYFFEIKKGVGSRGCANAAGLC